jgi:hypothetical protein
LLSLLKCAGTAHGLFLTSSFPDPVLWLAKILNITIPNITVATTEIKEPKLDTKFQPL